MKHEVSALRKCKSSNSKIRLYQLPDVSSSANGSSALKRFRRAHFRRSCCRRTAFLSASGSNKIIQLKLQMIKIIQMNFTKSL